MPRLLALLLATTCLAGCGQGESGAFLVSRDMAEAIGKGYYAETVADARTRNTLDADPGQVALVTDIAARLVEQAKRRYPVGRDWDWEIHVLASDEVNAFCAAGGKMLVLSGLLEAAGGDPDQVAMVIGHEIVHALREHARADLARDWLLQSGMWIVSKSLKMGAVRSQTAAADLTASLRPMARNQEREADAVGLELMAGAGFDPVRGLQFWRDAVARKGAVDVGQQRLEAFLSTHPTDEDRIARLSELAARWRKTEAKP